MIHLFQPLKQIWRHCILQRLLSLWGHCNANFTTLRSLHGERCLPLLRSKRPTCERGISVKWIVFFKLRVIIHHFWFIDEVVTLLWLFDNLVKSKHVLCHRAKPRPLCWRFQLHRWRRQLLLAWLHLCLRLVVFELLSKFLNYLLQLWNYFIFDRDFLLVKLGSLLHGHQLLTNQHILLVSFGNLVL